MTYSLILMQLRIDLRFHIFMVYIIKLNLWLLSMIDLEYLSFLSILFIHFRFNILDTSRI